MAARKPYKINVAATMNMRKRLKVLGMYPTFNSYEIYVTNTHRGYCDYEKKCITIPIWAAQIEPDQSSIHFNDKEYSIYYFCHEMAHSITGHIKGRPHGAEFMRNFIKLCPKDLQHFELGYKPRNAKAAGISARKPSPLQVTRIN